MSEQISGQISGQNEPPSHHGGLENLDTEHSYWIDDFDGTLPADLEGTFFRNGPGRQRIGDTRYGHWFDGDGMLCAFTFKDGQAHFKNAYVRTPKYVAETAQQDICYRGFGTQIPGGFRKNLGQMPANPANTNTIYHGGRLLALNEGGHPWQVDPADLSTVGEFDYEGSLERRQVFSAHGRVHPATGDYINFGAGASGIGLKGPKPCLNIYRINPAGKMIRKGQVPLTNFPFCHDFALTDRYAIFFIGSIVFDGMAGVMLGTRTISDVVQYDPNIDMQVLVVDLNDLSLVRQFSTGHGAIVHFGNAYQHGDKIVVDGCYQSGFEANSSLENVFGPESRFNGGFYKRYVLNLADGRMTETQICDTECEFPTFNTGFVGRENAVTYTACSVDNGYNGFFNGFQRIEHEGEITAVTLLPGYYGSEPLFAPASNARREDDGYLLEVVYDAYEHKSELQIFRADNLHDQVARLPLQHHLPHQFHGYFTPQVFI
ncbi:MAG: carotenoid oxygenase family protein [Pseudomonadales bacterium]